MDCEEVAIIPACIDIRVVRGSDNTFEFIITNGEGQAINITVDDITFTIKDTIDGTVTFQETSLAGFHLDAAGGKVAFTIPRTAIDDEAEATVETFWVYEVRRIEGGAGEQHVHIKGEFIIDPSVGI